MPPLPMQTFVHTDAEIMELSKACIAMSGRCRWNCSIASKPTVIVYRTSRMAETLIRPLLTTKYITLVNLLADEDACSRIASMDCEAASVSREVTCSWLNDERPMPSICRELLALRERAALPGACMSCGGADRRGAAGAKHDGSLKAHAHRHHEADVLAVADTLQNIAPRWSGPFDACSGMKEESAHGISKSLCISA